MDALTTAEHVLAKMMEAISGDSAPGGQANAAGFDEVCTYIHRFGVDLLRSSIIN